MHAQKRSDQVQTRIMSLQMASRHNIWLEFKRKLLTTTKAKNKNNKKQSESH